MDAITESAHPACDEGTALYLYWQFADRHSNPDTLAERRKNPWRRDPWFDLERWMEEFTNRLTAGALASSEIYFDPKRRMSCARLAARGSSCRWVIASSSAKIHTVPPARERRRIARIKNAS